MTIYIYDPSWSYMIPWTFVRPQTRTRVHTTVQSGKDTVKRFFKRNCYQQLRCGVVWCGVLEICDNPCLQGNQYPWVVMSGEYGGQVMGSPRRWTFRPASRRLLTTSATGRPKPCSVTQQRTLISRLLHYLARASCMRYRYVYILM